MTGIDTNVLIRYILQDDRHQSALAAKLIETLTEAQPGFITLVSVAEIYWVLERRYKFSRIQFTQAMRELILSEGILFEAEVRVVEALDLFSLSNTADFSDCLIYLSATHGGCDAVMTFDRLATRESGMTLLT